MGHRAAHQEDRALGKESVGDRKWGMGDTNLSDKVLMESRSKPYANGLEPSHSLAILVKINCCKFLSMTPVTLLILSRTTGNSGVRVQAQLGDRLRFKPWKNHLLKGRRGTSVCAHHPESLVWGFLAIIYIGNHGRPLESPSSQHQPTSVPSQLLRSYQESPEQNKKQGKPFFSTLGM